MRGEGIGIVEGVSWLGSHANRGREKRAFEASADLDNVAVRKRVGAFGLAFREHQRGRPIVRRYRFGRARGNRDFNEAKVGAIDKNPVGFWRADGLIAG